MTLVHTCPNCKRRFTCSFKYGCTAQYSNEEQEYVNICRCIKCNATSSCTFNFINMKPRKKGILIGERVFQ